MAKRRINPDLQLPTGLSGGAGGIVDTFIRPQGAPKPDTSLLEGLSTFSKGLADYTFQKNKEEVQELKAEWSADFKEANTIEELEKKLLDEEGKTIIEGMSPGRQRLYHQYAGKRYGELVSDKMWDPAFRGELTDPGTETPDIGARVQERANELLEFNEGHTATFRDAAQESMSATVNQLTVAIRQERGMRMKEKNHDMAVGQMSEVLERYGLSHVDIDESGEYQERFRKIAEDHKNATGEDGKQALVEALEGNIENEVRYLTGDTDLDSLTDQLAFVRHLLPNEDRTQYKESLDKLEAQVEEARTRQDDLKDRELDRKRRRDGEKVADATGTFIAEVLSADFDKYEAMDERELFNELMEWAGNDPRFEAEMDTIKADYVGIVKTFRDMVFNRPENPARAEEADKAVVAFAMRLYRNEFANKEEALSALSALSDEQDIPRSVSFQMIQDIRLWDSEGRDLQRRAAKLIATRSSEVIRQELKGLEDQMAQAIAGVNGVEYVESIQDNLAKRRDWEDRWEAATEFVSGTVTARLEAAVAIEVRNGMEMDEAIQTVTTDQMGDFVEEAITEWKELEEIQWDTAIKEETRNRVTKESATAAVGPSGADGDMPEVTDAFTILLGGNLPSNPRDQAAAREALEVLTNQETEPAKRRELWDAANAAFRRTFAVRSRRDMRVQHSLGDQAPDNFAIRIARALTNQGDTMFLVNGRESSAHTRLYYGMRQMGIKPYTARELAGLEGPWASRARGGIVPDKYRIDDNGIGLNNSGLGTKTLYDPTRTLYATDDKHLKEIVDSGEWRLFMQLYEEKYTPAYLSGTPKPQLDEARLKFFLDSQTDLIVFYGKHTDPTTVQQQEAE